MARSSGLLDVIRKIHAHHKREDGEIFYDKRLDAMLEEARIFDSTDMCREHCMVSLHTNDAGCSLKAIDGDGRHRKIKSIGHDHLEIEAPDAWI